MQVLISLTIVIVLTTIAVKNNFKNGATNSTQKH